MVCGAQQPVTAEWLQHCSPRRGGTLRFDGWSSIPSAVRGGMFALACQGRCGRRLTRREIRSCECFRSSLLGWLRVTILAIGFPMERRLLVASKIVAWMETDKSDLFERVQRGVVGEPNLEKSCF